MAVGQAGSRLLLFLMAVHLTRALSAERFGLIAFATSLLLYAGILVDFGVEAFGPREVSRQTTPLSTLVGTVVVLRLILFGLAMGGLVLFLAAITLPPLTETIVLLYGLSLLTNAVDLQWVFLGAERMRPAALAGILGQAVLTVGVFLLVGTPENVLRVPWIFLAGRAASVLLLWISTCRPSRTQCQNQALPWPGS